MASRKRDYKAEYARAKAKAQAAGYKSQREYRKARTSTGLSGRVSPAPRKVFDRIHDNESREWSKKHSKSPASKFSTKWGRERRDLYYRVFVEPTHDPNRRQDTNDLENKAWRNGLKTILVPAVYSLEEFNERYPS